MDTDNYKILPENPKTYYVKDIVVTYCSIDFKITITCRDFATFETWYEQRPCDIWYILEFDENQIPNIDVLGGKIIPIVNSCTEKGAIQSFKEFVDIILKRIEHFRN